jgi:hypothetical protein
VTRAGHVVDAGSSLSRLPPDDRCGRWWYRACTIVNRGTAKPSGRGALVTSRIGSGGGQEKRGDEMAMPDGSVLDRVREGMTVYDRGGDEVGTVKAVYFGAMEDSAGGHPPASVSEPAAASTQPLVDAVARALGRTELPDEVRERLLYQGFLHVDVSLAPDRLAMAEQIASVAADGVHLAVARDDLIRG